MPRVILAALVVAFALAIGANEAAANNGTRPSATTFTTTANRLTFTDEAGSFRFICALRLTLSLHASIAKLRETLAGLITTAAFSNCSGGNVRALAGTLPWHVQYTSFEGTLPSSLTGLTVQFLNVAFLLEVFFGIARCLWMGSPRATLQGARSELRTLLAEARDLIPLSEEALSSISCPENGRFEGTFTNSVTVRLTLL